MKPILAHSPLLQSHLPQQAVSCAPKSQFENHGHRFVQSTHLYTESSCFRMFPIHIFSLPIHLRVPFLNYQFRTKAWCRRFSSIFLLVILATGVRAPYFFLSARLRVLVVSTRTPLTFSSSFSTNKIRACRTPPAPRVDVSFPILACRVS